jgi:hypothetical protein
MAIIPRSLMSNPQANDTAVAYQPGQIGNIAQGTPASPEQSGGGIGGFLGGLRDKVTGAGGNILGTIGSKVSSGLRNTLAPQMVNDMGEATPYAKYQMSALQERANTPITSGGALPILDQLSAKMRLGGLSNQMTEGQTKARNNEKAAMTIALNAINGVMTGNDTPENKKIKVLNVLGTFLGSNASDASKKTLTAFTGENVQSLTDTKKEDPTSFNDMNEVELMDARSKAVKNMDEGLIKAIDNVLIDKGLMKVTPGKRFLGIGSKDTKEFIPGGTGQSSGTNVVRNAMNKEETESKPANNNAKIVHDKDGQNMNSIEYLKSLGYA